MQTSNMERIKIKNNEFKELLKDTEMVDVKEDGYGYILLIIANHLIDDSQMYEEHGCEYASRRCKEQYEKIYSFLKEHGYYQNL